MVHIQTCTKTEGAINTLVLDYNNEYFNIVQTGLLLIYYKLSVCSKLIFICLIANIFQEHYCYEFYASIFSS